MLLWHLGVGCALSLSYSNARFINMPTHHLRVIKYQRRFCGAWTAQGCFLWCHCCHRNNTALIFLRLFSLLCVRPLIGPLKKGSVWSMSTKTPSKFTCHVRGEKLRKKLRYRPWVVAPISMAATPGAFAGGGGRAAAASSTVGPL